MSGQSVWGCVNIVRVAEHCIRHGVVRVVSPESVRGTGAYMVRNGQPWILVSSSLSSTDRRFVIAHEVAEWAIGSATHDNEAECDRLAAALLMPRAAPLAYLARAVRVSDIALHYGASEASSVLRIGEVTGRPVAVKSPERFMRRGAQIDWPRAIENGAPQVHMRKCADAPRKVAYLVA